MAAPRVGPWQLAFWLLITLRVGLGLVALISVHLQPITVVGGDWLQLKINGGPWSELLSTWQRWDALWFQQIAEHGYHAGDGTAHFQPLFPLLSRVMSILFLGHVVPAELAVSSAAFVVSMWLLYRLACLDVDEAVARLAVLLVALFPTGFFLIAPYSESLFLALTLGSFWFARKGRPWLAGLCGLGAGLTRLVGIFLILPLAYEYLRQRDLRAAQEHRRPFDLGLLASTLPGIGLIAVSLWERVVVGERQSVLAMAAHWGDRVVAPWHPLPDSVALIAHTGDPIEIMNLICLILFGLLALVGFRLLPPVYTIYALTYLAFMFSRESLLSPFESVMRYLVVLFPCFFVLARVLVCKPMASGAWLAIGLMLQVGLLDYWVHFGFVA